VSVPIRSSFWAAEGLLAGEYPGALDRADAARRLSSFAEHGVTVFVDLTHPADGLESYERLLAPPARRLGHAIVDMGTTTIHTWHASSTTSTHARGRGGVRPAGAASDGQAVVGCWLMRHGLDVESDPADLGSAATSRMRGCRPRRRPHSARW
jgi:hypothetical protein